MTALLALLGSRVASDCFPVVFLMSSLTACPACPFQCRACFLLGSLYLTAEQIPAGMRLAAPFSSGRPLTAGAVSCSQTVGLSLVPNVSKIKSYLHSWVPLYLVLDKRMGLGACFQCIWQTAWTEVSAVRLASRGEFLARFDLRKLCSLGVWAPASL